MWHAIDREEEIDGKIHLIKFRQCRRKGRIRFLCIEYFVRYSSAKGVGVREGISRKVEYHYGFPRIDSLRYRKNSIAVHLQRVLSVQRLFREGGGWFPFGIRVLRLYRSKSFIII